MRVINTGGSGAGSSAWSERTRVLADQLAQSLVLFRPVSAMQDWDHLLSDRLDAAPIDGAAQDGQDVAAGAALLDGLLGDLGRGVPAMDSSLVRVRDCRSLVASSTPGQLP